MCPRSIVSTISVKSIWFRRKFHDANKDVDETVTEWLNRVQKLAKPCEFGKELNTFIWDKFIVGLDDNLLNHFCLDNKTISLDIRKALQTLRQHEDEIECNKQDTLSQNGSTNDSRCSSPLEQMNFACVNQKEELNDTIAIADTSIKKVKSEQIQSSADNAYSDYYQEQNNTKELLHSTKVSVPNVVNGEEPQKRRKYVMVNRVPAHLSKRREKVFECDICHYKCEHECHLRRHMYIHVNEKAYVCHVCGKGFNIFNYLTIHMKRHTNDRPFECEVCSKQFFNKTKLKRHFRVHTGEKPYNCSVCNKNFAQREYLTTHMRTHTGEKPFLCKICQKGFSQASSLATHRKIH